MRLCPDNPSSIHRVTLLESRTTIEQGTTGLKTWPAAHALAEWLGNHPGSRYPFSSRNQRSDSAVSFDRTREGKACPRVGIRRGVPGTCCRSYPTRPSRSRKFQLFHMVDRCERRCALPLPRQLEPAVQYVIGASDELERGYTFADASSRHQHLQFRQLDWFSALDANEISLVHGLTAEADPDVLLGADIVRLSFRSYHNRS